MGRASFGVELVRCTTELNRVEIALRKPFDNVFLVASKLYVYDYDSGIHSFCDRSFEVTVLQSGFMFFFLQFIHKRFEIYLCSLCHHFRYELSEKFVESLRDVI